jgi:hypothetical protein
MSLSKERKTYIIYGPAHFRATWAKFLEISQRDGQSGSELIRIWIEGYVKRKDPGNPQRPITAYAPGHEDELALRLKEIYARLRAYAEDNGGNIPRGRIIRELGAHLAGRPKVDTVDRMEQRLIEDGVKVWR